METKTTLAEEIGSMLTESQNRLEAFFARYEEKLEKFSADLRDLEAELD
jgi:Skp family chaperone for outer membrane proteins